MDNEYLINRRKFAEDFTGHEFETIRIAEYIKSSATIIDSEKFKKCLNGDNNGTKVFLIEGAYYGIDDFDSIFMSKGEYATEEERSEYEKVLKCPFDELPLFMGSEYATVQYVVREGF